MLTSRFLLALLAPFVLVFAKDSDEAPDDFWATSWLWLSRYEDASEDARAVEPEYASPTPIASVEGLVDSSDADTIEDVFDLDQWLHIEPETQVNVQCTVDTPCIDPTLIHNPAVRQDADSDADTEPFSTAESDLSSGGESIGWSFSTEAASQAANQYQTPPLQETVCASQELAGPISNDADEGPLYVNAKQFHRILERRLARQRLEESLRLNSKSGMPYLHRSRHSHAMRRPRGPEGRFLTADEVAEMEMGEPDQSFRNEKEPLHHDRIPAASQDVLHSCMRAWAGRTITMVEIMALCALTRLSKDIIIRWCKAWMARKRWFPKLDSNLGSKNDSDGDDGDDTGATEQQPPCSISQPDSKSIFRCTSACGKSFTRKGDWKRHEETHHPQDEWKCSACIAQGDAKPFVARRKDKILAHVKKEHGHLEHGGIVSSSHTPLQMSAQAAKCPFCGCVFDVWDIRINHVADHFLGRYDPYPRRLSDPKVSDVESNSATSRPSKTKLSQGDAVLMSYLIADPSPLATHLDHGPLGSGSSCTSSEDEGPGTGVHSTKHFSTADSYDAMRAVACSYMTEQPSKPYTCTYHTCEMRFETPAQLQTHKRDTHPQTPPSDALSVAGAPSSAISLFSSQAVSYRCDRTNPSTGRPCNVIFRRPYDLARHGYTIHSPRSEKVRCHFCTEEKTFSRNDALTRHMRVVHPEIDWLPTNHPGYIGPFCPDRQQQFPRPDNLQRYCRCRFLGKTWKDCG